LETFTEALTRATECNNSSADSDTVISGSKTPVIPVDEALIFDTAKAKRQKTTVLSPTFAQNFPFITFSPLEPKQYFS
jgi:hypothetical protein